MSTNSGTSGKINITGEDLAAVKYKEIHKYLLGLEAAEPPTGEDSEAIFRFINPWPEFAFEKILEPRFDGIGQFTGVVTNKPDLLKEGHFISLMRCVDYYKNPKYKGVVKGTVTGVAPTGITGTA